MQKKIIRATHKEKEFGKALSWIAEMYRGIAGLIQALREEMHERFDRLELLPEYKRRIEKPERKRRKV